MQGLRKTTKTLVRIADTAETRITDVPNMQQGYSLYCCGQWVTGAHDQQWTPARDRNTPSLGWKKNRRQTVLHHKSIVNVGRDSSVGIATRYGLGGPGIESRWRARFSAPFQTGPGAHPASYKMGTGSFPGVKRPGRGVDHPPPSSAEVKERVELYLYSPSGPSWPVLEDALYPLSPIWIKWVNPLKHSGYWPTLCITCCNIKMSAFCEHDAYTCMCAVCSPQHTALTFRNSTNRLVFVSEKRCVFSDAP